jgi:hypothetical protein
MQISGGPVTFTNAGGSTSTATVFFTVTDPKTSRTRQVGVSSTGRVTVQ